MVKETQGKQILQCPLLDIVPQTRYPLEEQWDLDEELKLFGKGICRGLSSNLGTTLYVAGLYLTADDPGGSVVTQQD